MAMQRCVLGLALLLGGGQAITSEMQGVLNKHNIYRCMHGVPPMTWDNAVAANAQSWATQGNYEHSQNSQRVINGEQCGENLAWGYPTYNGNKSTVAWYQEIQYTDPYGTATSMSDSHPAGEAIGHYTQVVWSDSTKLGCGKGRATVNSNEGDFWVCQYCTAGNYAGQFTQKVNAPVKSWSECGGSASDVPANFPTNLHSRSSGSTSGSSGSSGTTGTSGSSGSTSGADGSTSGTYVNPAGTSGSFTNPFGGDGGSTALGGTINGIVNLLSTDPSAFCQSTPALDAVEKGIAALTNTLPSAVDAWCQGSTRRLLGEAAPPRQLQSSVPVKYILQVPAGSDANAVAASLSNMPQDLAERINAELAAGTPFQIEVVSVSAQAAGDLSLESMPAEGGMVSDAGRNAALSTLPGLFAWPSTPMGLNVPATTSTGIAVMGLAVLVVVGMAVIVGARRHSTTSPAPLQQAVE